MRQKATKVATTSQIARLGGRLRDEGFGEVVIEIGGFHQQAIILYAPATTRIWLHKVNIVVAVTPGGVVGVVVAVTPGGKVGVGVDVSGPRGGVYVPQQY